ncbi:ankyrin repeat and MYND domain-containing protein 1 [Oryzias melastigma]|uniref:ankyrin repeat and MYND domain-containing protein 1 n=1 Tax=Oryzias melastigma TaxID=30732 RepID=UPI00168CE881|nr:ankyrin repeat and MYND domain-containing protein 1 [Oryzias melastigma]
MVPTTCKGGAETKAFFQIEDKGGAQVDEERLQEFDVQKWADGSKYEGHFVNGLKHGKGKYMWGNGEYYEGLFYKDYRHGSGQYCWPTGHKFTGKFYLNRREGYAVQVFPDGATFQGLYHTDQRFGPGVLTYPDGQQDVGLWLGKQLFRFCTSVGNVFSLSDFPEHAAYMDPAIINAGYHTKVCLDQYSKIVSSGLYHTDQRFGPGVLTYPDGQQDVGLWLGKQLFRFCTSVGSVFSLSDFPEHAAYMDPAIINAGYHTKPPFCDYQTKAKTDIKAVIHEDLFSDESFILPPGIECYFIDEDLLPLPPCQRRELDQHFFGELWESEAHPDQSYERDSLSPLSLQARMIAHTHKHRLQAETVGWDVAAVLSLNREGFGPRGPLEVSSELMIQQSFRGELQAVLQLLQTGSVHPDVTDSKGQTALIAATVNCQDDVIHLLLDKGADIDKLNDEGMSALAVCLLLYYPYRCLYTALAEPRTKTPVLKPSSSCGNTSRNHNPSTPAVNSRPLTPGTPEGDASSLIHLADQTSDEQTEHVSCTRPISNERLIPFHETCDNPEQPQGEDRKESNGWDEHCGDSEKVEEEGDGTTEEGEKKAEKRQIETNCDPDRDLTGVEDYKEAEYSDEEDNRENEMTKDEEMKIEEECSKKKTSGGVEMVEKPIEVMDGHILLGQVWWNTSVKKEDEELTTAETFGSNSSVSSHEIDVTEEMMQLSAEALSRSGVPHHDSEETVRKMAAMKVEHRRRLKTLNLLLQRGADPNRARVPMPVIFLAVMAADSEVVRTLILSGARCDTPLPKAKKGLYPLHIAAALPGPAGPRITEMLLHTIVDPDARACDQDDVFEPDEIAMKTNPALRTTESPCGKEGGRTALHIACQRESDHENASEVVALLLSHRASTDLLWRGHSPLSLAIASGNDLAVEELLKGGADPNLPLGPGVGSALCALANINYPIDENRVDMLDMLIRAGADMLMPVAVGGAVGTAVDYAYSSFNQDTYIARTPFHALNIQERKILKARQQLLSMMVDLLRTAVYQKEKDNLERQRQLVLKSAETVPSNVLLSNSEEKNREPAFKFCYQCGRSLSVKLIACSHCHRVFYCSRSCKLKAWDERHKLECMSGPEAVKSTQKATALHKNQKPVTAFAKTISPKVNITVKAQRGPEPFQMVENRVLENQVSLTENYSSN